MDQDEELEFIDNLDNALAKPRSYRPLKAKKQQKSVDETVDEKAKKFSPITISIVVGFALFLAYGLYASTKSALLTVGFISTCGGIAYCMGMSKETADDSSDTMQDLYYESAGETKKFLNSLNLYDLKDFDDYSDPLKTLDNVYTNNYGQDKYPKHFFNLLQYAYVSGQFNEAKEVVQNSDKMRALSKALTKIDSYESKPQDQKKYNDLKASYYLECKDIVKQLTDLFKPTIMREASRILNNSEPEDVKLLPKRYQQKAVDDFMKNL